MAGKPLAFGLILIALAACSGGRPDGRLRSIRDADPAPRGGEYAVAEHLASFELPGKPINLTIHRSAKGAALYVFMNEIGMAVFDLAKPESPALAGVVAEPPLSSGARLTYLHSGAVDGNEMYVSERAGNRILIYDVSQPLAPFFHEAIAMAGSAPVQVLPVGDRLIIPQGAAGMIELPRRPEAGSMPKPLLHDWDYVKEAALYPPPPAAPSWLLAADNYDGGLRVMDLKDPAHPREAAAFQTGGFCDSLLAFDGFAVVSNRTRGLMAIDLSQPARPFILSMFSEHGDDAISCMAHWGARGLVAGQRMGFLDVFDFADPKNPIWMGRIPTRRPVNCIAVDGDMAYVGTEWPNYSGPDARIESLQVWRLEKRIDKRAPKKSAEKPGVSPDLRPAAR